MGVLHHKKRDHDSIAFIESRDCPTIEQDRPRTNPMHIRDVEFIDSRIQPPGPFASVVTGSGSQVRYATARRNPGGQAVGQLPRSTIHEPVEAGLKARRLTPIRRHSFLTIVAFLMESSFGYLDSRNLFPWY